MSYPTQFGALVEGKEAGREEVLAEIMPFYSAALDEVYRLRRALVAEADLVDRLLEFKSFPKSRVTSTREQVRRMRALAAGVGKPQDYWWLLNDPSHPTLTRPQWEREVTARTAVPVDGED